MLLYNALLILHVLLLNAYALAYTEQELIEHVKISLHNGNFKYSKLPESLFALEGLTGRKTQHFLNNVCSLPNATYLEVGVYCGKTFISSLYENTTTLANAYAIDNWSEFGGSLATFTQNTQDFSLPANSFTVFDSDSFSLDTTVLKKPIDIYFYDGDHSADSQYEAFDYFNPILSDIFIAIVDDWNWEVVQKSTREAFKDLNYTILYEQELHAQFDTWFEKEGWWNGLYVAVIKKDPKIQQTQKNRRAKGVAMYEDFLTFYELLFNKKYSSQT